MGDELKAKDRKNALASKWKEHSTFPVLERKGGPSAAQMGESRFLYVRIKGSVLIAPSVFFT